jgi:FAD/FMN-containing dehydrogenase
VEDSLALPVLVVTLPVCHTLFSPVARARWRHRGGSISAKHGTGRARLAELEHYKSRPSSA